MCMVNYLSLNRLQNLHFVNICPQMNTDYADNVDDANNYIRVIGIAQLKAFSCAKDIAAKLTIQVILTQ